MAATGCVTSGGGEGIGAATAYRLIETDVPPLPIDIDAGHRCRAPVPPASSGAIPSSYLSGR